MNPDIPAVTRKRIADDLRTLGLARGNVVLMHSSLSALVRVEGGPGTVLDALLDVITPEGTLLLPSFQNGGEYDLLQKGCSFDVRSSPAELGIITETFRLRPGVIRSLSPTHCLAGIGRDAETILADHQRCSVSAGRGSPFEKFIAHNGKIILLGVTHGSNTTLHYVENISGAPTISQQLFKPVVIDRDGHSHVVPTYPHMPGLQRKYARVEDVLLAAGIQRNGNVGPAMTRLVDAPRMVDLIGQKVRQDPLYLIEVFTP